MFGVVRVRGSVHLRGEIKRTLALLGLNRVNRLCIIPESESYKSMLKKAKDYITWGEIDQKTIVLTLKKRGKTSQAQGITEHYLKEKKLNSIEELGEKINRGSTLKSLGLKPFIALKPPRKGFERKGIKKSYSIGGALGYRGKSINELIKRML